jgi:hypothetical protein
MHPAQSSAAEAGRAGLSFPPAGDCLKVPIMRFQLVGWSCPLHAAMVLGSCGDWRSSGDWPTRKASRYQGLRPVALVTLLYQCQAWLPCLHLGNGPCHRLGILFLSEASMSGPCSEKPWPDMEDKKPFLRPPQNPATSPATSCKGGIRDRRWGPQLSLGIGTDPTCSSASDCLGFSQPSGVPAHWGCMISFLCKIPFASPHRQAGPVPAGPQMPRAPCARLMSGYGTQPGFADCLGHSVLRAPHTWHRHWWVVNSWE